MAGNIKIIEPRENYQKVAKSIIFNEKVDALTLGIYVKVLCLGKKWELNIKGLASTLHVSAYKIRASFAILEETGYLRRTRVQGSGGRFSGWDYEVSSAPLTDIAKTPTSVKTECRETPTSEKCPAINRDNILENRDSNCKTKTQDFTPPTTKEVADYVRSRGWSDPEGFAKYYVSYHTESKWHMSNGKPIRNWKLNVVAWEPNNKNRYFSRPSFTPTPKAPAPAMQEVSFEELTNM